MPDALVCKPHNRHFARTRAYPQTCPQCGYYSHCPACFAEHKCDDTHIAALIDHKLDAEEDGEYRGGL